MKNNSIGFHSIVLTTFSLIVVLWCSSLIRYKSAIDFPHSRQRNLRFTILVVYTSSYRYQLCATSDLRNLNHGECLIVCYTVAFVWVGDQNVDSQKLMFLLFLGQESFEFRSVSTCLSPQFEGHEMEMPPPLTEIPQHNILMTFLNFYKLWNEYCLILILTFQY